MAAASFPLMHKSYPPPSHASPPLLTFLSAHSVTVPSSDSIYLYPYSRHRLANLLLSDHAFITSLVFVLHPIHTDAVSQFISYPFPCFACLTSPASLKSSFATPVTADSHLSHVPSSIWIAKWKKEKMPHIDFLIKLIRYEASRECLIRVRVKVHSSRSEWLIQSLRGSHFSFFPPLPSLRFPFTFHWEKDPVPRLYTVCMLLWFSFRFSFQLRCPLIGREEEEEERTS